MKTQKKAVRNLGALVGVQFINYLLPLIVIPVIVRIIGPSNFGIINYASTVIGYFTLLIGFTFELSAVRLVTININNHPKVNRIFNKVLFAKITLFIISCILFCGLLAFSTSLHQDRLVAIFTFLICISTVLDPNWFFTAKQDLHQTATFSLIAKALLNITLLLAIRRQDDYIYQPLIASVIQILVMGGALLWAIHRYNIKIYFPGLKAIWDIIWKAKVLFFHSFSHTIYTTLNIVILGMLKGPLAVGYYTAGWKLIILIQVILISPLAIVLFPILGSTFKNSKEKGIDIIQKSLPVILILTTTIGVFILIFGKIFIILLYGSKFHNSISIFKLLSFMPMFLCLNMLLGIQTMVNLKMDKKFFIITVSAAFISLIINPILIYNWSASGAAISWCITELFCVLTMYLVLSNNNIQLINYKYFKINHLKTYLIPVLNRLREKYGKFKNG